MHARDMHIMTMVMHQTEKLEGTGNGPERRWTRNGCPTGQMRVSTVENDRLIRGKPRKTPRYSPRKLWAQFTQSAGGGVCSLLRSSLCKRFPCYDLKNRECRAVRPFPRFLATNSTSFQRVSLPSLYLSVGKLPAKTGNTGWESGNDP